MRRTPVPSRLPGAAQLQSNDPGRRPVLARTCRAVRPPANPLSGVDLPARGEVAGLFLTLGGS
jgi:hypothetical protein